MENKITTIRDIRNLRFVLAVATFIIFIVIPMTFEYYTTDKTGSDYQKIVDDEYSQFMGIDIYALVALFILAATSKELDKALLFIATIGLVIYVMVLTQEAKNTDKTKITKKRALQAKMGFFTNGIIVGLTGYVISNYIRLYIPGI